MVNRISGAQHQALYGNYRPENADRADKTAAETPQGTAPAAGEAAKVTLGGTDRSGGLQMQVYGPDTAPFKTDPAFFTPEARERRREEAASRMVATDPFDNEFQIRGVTYTFHEGTLESFIAGSLEGKAQNPSLVASELGKMIRSAANWSAPTAEERAALRETGMRQAEYIAENYFDDPDEAKAFLDGVRKFYDNDVLREKGYSIIDNAKVNGLPLEPLKPYQTVLSREAGEAVSWDALLKEYGVSDARKLAETEGGMEAFLSALQENREAWSRKIIDAFSENERQVDSLISLVKASLSEDEVTKGLQRLLKAF